MGRSFLRSFYEAVRTESDSDAVPLSDSNRATEKKEREERSKQESILDTDEANGKTHSRGEVCSLWQASWNLVNMIEGTGVLGLPFAVKEGGIVVILGLAVLAIISNYTGQVLIGCLYNTKREKANKDEEEELLKNESENHHEKTKDENHHEKTKHENHHEKTKDENHHEKTKNIRVRSTYEDIGEACFPRFGGKTVITVQIIELVSVSTLYLILSGTLLVHTFPNVHVSQRGWIILSALFVLPTVFLKSLAHIAWLSFLSTVALLSTVIAVIWYGISVHTKWDTESITKCNIETMPVGIGIVLFSYAAHPLLPGIEESLKDKSKFPLIMNISFIFAAITKVLFSVLAYLAFGDTTMEVITNNLPLGAVRTSACVLLVLNVLFSYAFPMFTVIQCVTDSIVSRCCVPETSTVLFSVTVRLTLVFLTFIFAVLIPHFALLMSLIGNFTGACLVFIFPAVFHQIIRQGELKVWQRGIDMLIILFGVLTGSVGVVYSGKALFLAYTA